MGFIRDMHGRPWVPTVKFLPFLGPACSSDYHSRYPLEYSSIG